MPRKGFFVIALALLVVHFLRPVASYGEPVSGVPSYQERTFASLINAARVGPSGYRTNYMAGYSTAGILTTKARPPVYIDPKLSQTARNHSVDLTTCHWVQTSSCDGAWWTSRLRKGYGCYRGVVSENVQFSYANNPLTAANDGLCSWAWNSAGAPICCPDGGKDWSGKDCDRARKNFLSSSFTRVGSGEAYDSLNGLSYWTTDLGSCSTQTYSNLIASGAHIVQSGNTRFFATFWDRLGAPHSAQVVINGVSIDLALDTGVAGMGNYYAQIATASDCRSYFFQFVSARGGVYRYPETGYFLTFGEGVCATDWSSSAPPGANATVPGVPQSVGVSGVTSSSAVISWAAPATDGGSAVTGYNLTLTATGSTTTYHATGTSFTLTGLASGTAFEVAVQAENSVGSGPGSPDQSFITQDTPASPSASPSKPASPSPSPSNVPSHSPSQTPSSSPSSAASRSPSPTGSPSNSPSQSPLPTPSPLPSSAPNALPAAYDFHTQTSCFSGILNQASCGSCYAFSTASSSADRLCYFQGPHLVLSPQEILDCGKDTVWWGNSGCDGGDPYAAASLVASNGLPTSDSPALLGGCRPYTCGSGTCSSNPTCSATCQNGTRATKYHGTGSALVSGVDNIRTEIYDNGPVTAAFSVCQSFYDFFGQESTVGQVYTTQCSSSSSDYVGGHAVSVIGWGTNSDGVDFWLIANSWSVNWGDNGFFRIQRGVNLCGIEDYVVKATFAKTNKRGQQEDYPVQPVAKRGLSVLTGIPIIKDPSDDGVLSASQLVLDQWYLNNNEAVNQGVDVSNQSSSRKRDLAPPAIVTTYTDFSITGVNSATVQVAAGQNVFVDFVASDGVNTVNLKSTVSYDATGEVSSITAGGGASSAGLSGGAIAGIVVGSVAGAVLLAALAAAAVVGVVVAVRHVKSRDSDQRDVEMEAVPRQQHSAESGAEKRRKGKSRFMFTSITARSPPIKLDE